MDASMQLQPYGGMGHRPPMVYVYNFPADTQPNEIHAMVSWFGLVLQCTVAGQQPSLYAEVTFDQHAAAEKVINAFREAPGVYRQLRAHWMFPAAPASPQQYQASPQYAMVPQYQPQLYVQAAPQQQSQLYVQSAPQCQPQLYIPVNDANQGQNTAGAVLVPTVTHWPGGVTCSYTTIDRVGDFLNAVLGHMMENVHQDQLQNTPCSTRGSLRAATPPPAISRKRKQSVESDHVKRLKAEQPFGEEKEATVGASLVEDTQESVSDCDDSGSTIKQEDVKQENIEEETAEPEPLEESVVKRENIEEDTAEPESIVNSMVKQEHLKPNPGDGEPVKQEQVLRRSTRQMRIKQEIVQRD